jgi:hypothetical protein
MSSYAKNFDITTAKRRLLMAVVAAAISACSGGSGERRASRRSTPTGQSGDATAGEAAMSSPALGGLELALEDLNLSASADARYFVRLTPVAADGTQPAGVDYGPFADGQKITVNDLTVGSYAARIEQRDATNQTLAAADATVTVDADVVSKFAVKLTPASPAGDPDPSSGAVPDAGADADAGGSSTAEADSDGMGTSDSDNDQSGSDSGPLPAPVKLQAVIDGIGSFQVSPTGSWSITQGPGPYFAWEGAVAQIVGADGSTRSVPGPQRPGDAVTLPGDFSGKCAHIGKPAWELVTPTSAAGRPDPILTVHEVAGPAGTIAILEWDDAEGGRQGAVKLSVDIFFTACGG